MSNTLFVVDTCAIISYMPQVFDKAIVSVSQKALKVIDSAFNSESVSLIFPSTVFIEIIEKWCRTDESTARIKAEVYQRIKAQPNMEIQPFDSEVLTNFLKITDIERGLNFDNHDKQILAAAMTMQCPLITSDEKIIKYNEKRKVIPRIIT